MEADEEIKALFAQYTYAYVTKRDDGVWVVKGNIDLFGKELVELPFKGITYEVTRDFTCQNNQLTSLEGAPQSVGGDFYCHNNRLVTLYGAPKLVKGDFYASFFDKNGNGNTGYSSLIANLRNKIIESNPLISLMGCPEEICGNLHIYNSNLVNFAGISSKIGGKILCDGNPLTSLDDLPEGWEEKLCDHNGEKFITTLIRTPTNQTKGMQF